MYCAQETIFCEQYERIEKCLTILWVISTVPRLALAILYSFDKAFGNNHWKITLSFSIILLGLKIASRYSISVKKLYFFFFAQCFCIICKYMSLELEPQAKSLYCIVNTILVLKFENLIYSNNVWIAMSMLKFIVFWYGLDFENFEYEVIIRGLSYRNFVCIVFIVLATCFFESLERKLYASEFEAKQICKDAHDQLFDILKVFPDGLMVIGSDFTLKFKNNTMTELLNKADDPIAYLNSLTILNNNPSILQQINEFMGKTNIEASLGIISIDSKQFECRVHKIKWDTKDSCMLTIKDVTSILTLERINSENNAKNSIIRSITHEFRTPINCIDLIIEELLPKLAKEFQEKLEFLKINTKLMVYQLNDILDYSDITLGKLKLIDSEVNFKDELLACTQLIKHQADYKGLSVIHDIESSVPEKIVIDSYRLKKVVVNLLTNSLKYTSVGSIKLFARCKENFLEIGVEDTGIGIPLERQKRLFEMLSNQSDSSLCGLGLYVSKKIIENLNSTLIVASTFGEGTTFSFSLDLDQIASKNSVQDTSSDNVLENIPNEIDIASESISSSKLKNLIPSPLCEDYAKLLIVDDNEFNRMCLGSMMKNAGIQHIEAINGEVAVSKVLESDKNLEPVKCIIMDINMPVMDGWEATRLINQLYAQGKLKTLPTIIAHTAYCSQEDMQKCYDAGMITYLVKPTPQSQIISIIRKYVY